MFVGKTRIIWSNKWGQMKRYFSYLFLVFAWPSLVYAEVPTVDIREWDVPYADSRPRDPYVAPDGRVWFCGQTGAYIAVLDPATGVFKKYDMEDNERPHNLIIDSNGTVWYAGNTQGYIGQLDPASGEIKKHAMPEGVRDPHTLVFDSKDDIWFTAQNSNYIGKFTISNGQVQIVEVPTAKARPYGIWMDSKDRPWVALFGTNKLATIDPKTFVIEEIVLPRGNTLPRRLAVTSDNTVWYVDYKAGYVGQYNPANEAIEEWRLPGRDRSRPYGMIVDDHDQLWFVETGIDPNRLIGFDTRTKKVISQTDIPSGGGTVRHMMFHSASKTIWFGTDTNTVGRAKIPAQ